MPEVQLARKAVESDLPTPVARLYVRMIAGFGVGVAIGLAPFLGKIDIPLFSSLLSLFPVSIKHIVLPASSFLMGLLGAATQFYIGTKLTLSKIERYAKIALTVDLCALVLLLLVYPFLVTRVHFRDDFVVAVVTGPSRAPNCPCPLEVSDAQCIKMRSINPDSLDICWSKQSVGLSEFLLCALYLALTGSFAGLAGLLILQKEGKRQRIANSKARKKRRAKSAISQKKEP